MATEKQLKFIMSIRQTLKDHDEVIGGSHELPDANTVWSMSKQDASKFISKYMKEFKDCWAELVAAQDN